MLLTPHTFVGVAIATSVPNPYISVPLAFLMHFIGDKIPHWDFLFNKRDFNEKDRSVTGWTLLAMMADLILGVGVGLTFTLYALWVKADYPLSLNIFLCGIASVLPDALTAPYLFLGKVPRVMKVLPRIHFKLHSKAPFHFGIFTQLVVIAAALFLILSSV